MTNKQFIDIYLYPLKVHMNNVSNTNYSAELLKRVNTFLSTNDSLDLPSFTERAKNVFGEEVEACSKIIQYKKLDSINQKLMFFMVITIISMIVGLIAALANIS